MKKINTAILIVFLATIAAWHIPKDSFDANRENMTEKADNCLPDPEYFRDCMIHNETRINTTLLIHGKTIFIENIGLNDRLDIWENILDSFPPHITKNILRVTFDAEMSNGTHLMESVYESHSDKPCGMKWSYYPYCVNNWIKVKRNATAFLSRKDYEGYISHEIGHSVKLNYPDMDMFSYLNSLNTTSDNFVSQYAMSSTESDKEDFAESIKFWRGNTKLLENISQRNMIMRTKFEIVARQICFNNTNHTTICPIYVSQKAIVNGSQNYNGTTYNYDGLFENDLTRKDIVIDKNLLDISFDDIKIAISDLKINGT